MKTFFTSDLHLEHKRIVEYTDRKDVLYFMQGKEVYSVDHHKVIVE